MPPKKILRPRYHLHGVRISKDQAHTLCKGGKIKIQHGHLTGPHKLHLTKTQLKHLAESHRAGKSAELRLSKSQIAHSKKVGGSVLSEILKYLKPVVSDLVKKGAKSVGNKLLDYGLKKVGLGVGKRKRLGAKTAGKAAGKRGGSFAL
jgi:hypothetical protein